MIKAIQETLNSIHPIRRLLTPFIFGSAYANRVYNEYSKRDGLFHRVFAFQYQSLCKLIQDSMSDAPPKRSTKDLMKYRYKLISVECGLYINSYIFISHFIHLLLREKCLR